MRLLSRTIFREIAVSAALGGILFTFVLFLKQARPLFEFLVRDSGAPRTIAYLFALVLPQALPFTIPLGVLVATLITLSRMSADGEITAMRAAGVPGRRVTPAILTFGFVAMCIAAASTLWLTPWSFRELNRVKTELLTGSLTANIEPRVFAEQFPNSILYVSDVVAGPTAQWKKVFLADVTSPESRTPGASDRGDSPLITLASEALAAPDVGAGRIQLALRNGSTYAAGKDPAHYNITAFPSGDQALQAQKPEAQASRPSAQMDTGPLFRQAYRNPSLDPTAVFEARVELNRRLALPLACVLLALAGIPLGITRRRSGKSAAVVLTAGVAFLYYMGLISFINLAEHGKLSAEAAVWLPNLLFAIFGVVALARLELPGDYDLIARFAARFGSLLQSTGRVANGSAVANGTERGPWIFERAPRVLERLGPQAWLARFSLLPQLVDAYILASFLFYFAVLLGSFVAMYQIFTFFDLLSDIIRHHTELWRVLSYHFFLTPRLIYEFAPISVLAAVLVTIGVLSKNNEITAFKACGVSVYRLAAPVLIVALLLSCGLFAFDHYTVPKADRQQDAIYAEIKGKPPQTYLRPDRKWIFDSLHNQVFFYKYFDQAERVMLGPSVYEIDPERFVLKKHISAERARWEPRLKAWVFQNGWSREMKGGNVTRFDDFSGDARTFPEIDEPPNYFTKEVVQSKQMNFQELSRYIRELQQSGFDTVALQVQLYKKFSVPLFALILAMVSLPFAFLAGNRGSMTGVGISLAIWIAYSAVGQVFEQMGNLNQLPPQVAAWAPDVVFSLGGLYFLTRMRT